MGVIKLPSGFGIPEFKIVKTPRGYKIMIIPAGFIGLWSGTIANIPTGWHLCDGTNSTPDLRDKFILGVSAEENPGGMGGAHNRTLSIANLPAHTHGAINGHTHYCKSYHHAPGVQSQGLVAPDMLSNLVGYMTQSAGGHTHSSVGSDSSFDNRPAYYKLAYIMKL